MNEYSDRIPEKDYSVLSDEDLAGELGAADYQIDRERAMHKGDRPGTWGYNESENFIQGMIYEKQKILREMKRRQERREQLKSYGVDRSCDVCGYMFLIFTMVRRRWYETDIYLCTDCLQQQVGGANLSLPKSARGFDPEKVLN